MAGSLESVPIVDLSQGMAGGLTSLLLAEQGADVIKVEPSGGDPYREIDAGWFIWNRSKRSIILDLENRSDRDNLLSLLKQSDVLLETFAPGTLAKWQLDYEHLKDRVPHLVYCSLTAYGQDHPWRDRPAIDALVGARTGLIYEQLGNRPGPIFIYYALPSYGAAFAASMAICAALRVRSHTSQGQWIDTSLYDGVMLMTGLIWQWCDNPNPNPTWKERATSLRPYRPFLYQCADGLWFHRMITAKGNLDAIAKLLGIKPPTGPARAMPSPEERTRFFNDEIKAYKKRPRAEWIKLLRDIDVPVEVVTPTEEAFGREQTRANGLVAEIADPRRGRVTQIGLPIRFSKSPGAIKSLAPRAGEHTAGVLREIEMPRGAPPKALKPRQLRYPLDGVTVLDFGVFFAGPYGPMALADLGARVIKVEPTTGEANRQPTQVFMGSQRGKQDLAVDLKRLEGLEIVHRLVARTDVVHHNQRPGVAERLKIDYETLRKIKPDLIYCHSPAYGVLGPEAHMGGYDQLFQAMCGIEVMGAGEDNDPIWMRFGHVDTGGGLLSACGAIMGLYHRDVTGEGQFIDTSLLNSGMWFNSDAFIAERSSVRKRPTLDHNQTGLSASCRLYETKRGWICVAALFKEDWQALCEVLEKPELGRDPRYFQNNDRIDNRAYLGELLEPIFKTKTAEEWFTRLDSACVPCEICHQDYWREFLLDEWALKTGRVVEYLQKDMNGKIRIFGTISRFSATPQVIQGPPPLLGEHTRQILAELGYGNAEQEMLKAKGVVTW